MSLDAQASDSRNRWLEWEVLWLILFVVVAYFARAGQMPLRGEEPTRAQMAREMVERNDWIVPREQGDAFLIRPPLQNWAIALSCTALGSWNEWSVRFHAVVSTLLSTLLIYAYGRTFLSRIGALAAGVAFATLPENFQQGRQAETEAIFTFLVSASQLVWHMGWVRRWPRALSFAAGYGFMTLALLTKSIQAPVYFVGPLVIYLVWMGEWRAIFSRAHLTGILVGAAILLAWVIPYAFAVGWSNVPHVWFGDPAIAVNKNVGNWRFDEWAKHLVSYPLEIAAGTLPWSLMLLAFLRREVRQSLQPSRPQILFTSLCLIVAFPTCWIPLGGLARYFAPLYPCFCVLVGAVIEQAASRPAVPSARALWRGVVGVVAAIAFLGAAALSAATILRPKWAIVQDWAPEPALNALYAAAFVGIGLVIWRANRSASAWPGLTVLAVGACLVVGGAGVFTDSRVRRSTDPVVAMARIKEHLPPGQPLVSIDGHTHPLFAFYFGEPFITPARTPSGDDVGDFEYFCFFTRQAFPVTPPFAWQEVGAMPVDRYRRPVPDQQVIVGRRLPAAPNSRSVPAVRTSVELRRTNGENP